MDKIIKTDLNTNIKTNNFNINIFNTYLSLYIKNFSGNFKDEKYKWQAIKHFQNTWDENAPNFMKMFLSATSEHHNLLDTRQYRPRKMLSDYANALGEAKIKELFINLYNESIDLKQRLTSFFETINELNEKYDNGKWQSYNDARAVSVYLWMRYPDKYYIFKLSIFEEVKSILNLNYNFVKGRHIDNIINGLNMIDEIKSRLIKNQNLIKLYQSHLDETCDEDKNFNTLTQDFLHFISSKQYGGEMENIFLNQILYGPPGTGKTYNTVIKAMEIINGEKYDFVDNEQYKDLKKQFDNLKQQGQIEFVTFHQSYSYEEFVEGIKPDLKNNKLMYTLESGIFKKICSSAKELLETKVKYNFKKDNISVYKILIPDELIFQYCIDNNCVAINWGDEIDISDCNTQEEIANKIPENFESRKQCISQLNLFKLWIDKDLKNGKDVIVVIPGSMNTIKGIAKITGDYFYNSDIENGHQQRKVDWIRKNINISSDSIYNSKFVSPTITGMFNDKINWDTFLNLINNKNNSKSSNAVLVIDEINRGDVSKIFGELITLIEEDKRIGENHQMTVTLPYSREPFGVPNNLYIIGTMNTADRSIALLDTALRRRFDFEEMMPKPEKIVDENKQPQMVEDINLQNLLKNINERISHILDRDHQIGHSYLMGVKNKEQLERAYKNRILPLLNEYFYNDIDSVAKVLNCKPDEISSKENWFNVLKEAQKPTKKEND